MTEVKFCKDCKFQTGINLYGELLCSRKHKLFTKKDKDLITGKYPKRYFLECTKERSSKYPTWCGPEAKYFEKRKTFWSRILELFKERK